MVRYTARRLALSIVTLLLVSVIVFSMTEMLPGDVATALLGRESTPERLAQLRTELGLDRSPVDRYLDWLRGAVRGDFGVSSARNEAINDLLPVRLRNTMLMAGIAGAIGIPLSLLLGVLAGLARDRAPDVAISIISLIGMSLPEFVVGSIMILLFSLSWRWFPAVTTVPADASLTELLPNVWLPAATLTVVMAAYIVRMVRTSLIDVMASDYVLMASLKGLSRRRIVRRHALPNALLPAINAVAQTVAWLVGGVVIVESVFNYPGIGRLLVNGVHDRDLPLVQALVLLGAAFYIAINLIADLLTILLSPKLRTMRT